MPRNAEGMLDDIGPASPEPAAATPEPAQTEPEPASSEPPVARAEADARPDSKTDPANAPDRPDGYIPKQALSRVQQELAAERQARERAEGNFQKFLDRWHAEQEQVQAAQREAEPQFEDPGQAPDPEADPMGWIVWRNRKDAFNEQQTTVQRNQQVEQQRRMGEFHGAVKSDVQSFKAQTPDYDHARDFYWNQRGPELMALGYTQDQAIAAIEQDELQIANLAFQRRQSPAATLYNIAKARGYQGKAPAPAADTGEAGRELPERAPNGQFLAAEAEKAARIKTSQERNGSLSSAPGVPVEKMTAKEFAKFDESRMWQEFDKMKGRKGSKQFEKDMGFR